jgi:hypothetical protein
VDDTRAENNWAVSVIGCGSAPPSAANRAAMYAQSVLALKCDLLLSVDAIKKMEPNPSH